MVDQMNSEHEAYFKTVFEEFDIDKSGSMSRQVLFFKIQEVCLLMGALGENLSDTKIDELISQIDTDGNGTIECDEFLHLMHMYIEIDLE